MLRIMLIGLFISLHDNAGEEGGLCWMIRKR